MRKAKLRRLVEELVGEKLRELARRRLDAATARVEQVVRDHAAARASKAERPSLHRNLARLEQLVAKRGARLVPAPVTALARKVAFRLGRIFDYSTPDELPDFEWLPGTPDKVRDEIRTTWRSVAQQLESDLSKPNGD